MLDKYFPLYATVFIISLSITIFAEKRLIPSLREFAKQPIYTEGPTWHMKKSGTPTMGGLAFIFASLGALLPALVFSFKLISRESAISLALAIAYAILNSAVGILDDLKKLKRRKNAGLTPMQKLIFQFLFAGAYLFLRHLLLPDTTMISFSFGEVELGLIYYPLTMLLLVGIVNFANLTDGIDGLASSVAFSIGISLFYISVALSEEGAMLSALLMGISLGFLFFNLHPAKIFMGDTGSLFLGGLISAIAVGLKNPLILIFVCGAYVIEGISVILQVFFFKLTGKRIFKMSPLHHHLEKCGWSENKICVASMLSTLVFSVPVYVFYLP